MANTLFDVISQNSATPAAPQLGETEKAQNLLRAKTGKDIGTGSEPGISDLSERAAADQTRLNLIPLQQQAGIQSAGIAQQSAGIEQGRQIQQAQNTQARRGLSLQGQIQTNDLLQNMEQQKGSLSLEKDKSKLEQLAFGLRMQDQSYIDNLNMEGAKQRLNSEQDFQTSLQGMIFGEQTDLLQKALGGKSVLEAGDREFNQFLNNLNIDQAKQLATIDLSHASKMNDIEMKFQGQQMKQKAEEEGQKSQWGAIGKLPGALTGLLGGAGGGGAGAGGGAATDTGLSTTTNIA